MYDSSSSLAFACIYLIVVGGLLWLFVYLGRRIMRERGGQESLGGWLGFLLGPIGLILCALWPVTANQGLNPGTGSGHAVRKQCVACKELIHADATICPHCRTAQ